MRLDLLTDLGALLSWGGHCNRERQWFYDLLDGLTPLLHGPR